MNSIVFTFADGHTYTLTLRDGGVDLHRLAMAIRDGEIKAITVESSSALFERVSYAIVQTDVGRK